MANPTHLTLMIYTDAFILYEYHGNNEFWVWWWSTRVNIHQRELPAADSKEK